MALQELVLQHRGQTQYKSCSAKSLWFCSGSDFLVCVGLWASSKLFNNTRVDKSTVVSPRPQKLTSGEHMGMSSNQETPKTSPNSDSGRASQQTKGRFVDGFGRCVRIISCKNAWLLNVWKLAPTKASAGGVPNPSQKLWPPVEQMEKQRLVTTWANVENFQALSLAKSRKPARNPKGCYQNCILPASKSNSTPGGLAGWPHEVTNSTYKPKSLSKMNTFDQTRFPVGRSPRAIGHQKN